MQKLQEEEEEEVGCVFGGEKTEMNRESSLQEGRETERAKRAMKVVFFIHIYISSKICKLTSKYCLWWHFSRHPRLPLNEMNKWNLKQTRRE